jgi:ShK domain-like
MIYKLKSLIRALIDGMTACPTVQLDEDGFLCIEISAFIVFTVDDRTVDDVNCSEAMETAIEDGRLQGSLVYVGSNASVLFFFGEELPPDFLAPSNETNSTAEPGSDDSTTMDPTSDATTVSPSQQSSARQSSAPSAAPSLTSGPEEPTQTPEGSSSCVDTSTLCADWAAREPSECERNRDYMALTCPKSCDACDEQTQSPSAGNETGTMSPSPTASPSSSDSTNTSDFFPTSSPSNFTDEDTPAPSSNFTDDDTPAPSSSSSLSCSDSREECPKWAEAGECTGNPGFMLKNCQKACGECDGADGEAVCDDDREECPAWADVGECENNPKFMLENCKKTCGQCQSNDDAGTTCQDVRDECPEWADVGECENNPKFMLENCQQSCGACP